MAVGELAVLPARARGGVDALGDDQEGYVTHITDADGSSEEGKEEEEEEEEEEPPPPLPLLRYQSIPPRRHLKAKHPS